MLEDDYGWLKGVTHVAQITKYGISDTACAAIKAIQSYVLD